MKDGRELGPGKEEGEEILQTPLSLTFLLDNETKIIVLLQQNAIWMEKKASKKCKYRNVRKKKMTVINETQQITSNLLWDMKRKKRK